MGKTASSTCASNAAKHFAEAVSAAQTTCLVCSAHFSTQCEETSTGGKV